jgi:hypothetical protein
MVELATVGWRAANLGRIESVNIGTHVLLRDSEPTECPVCNRPSPPMEVAARFQYEKGVDGCLEAVYFCAHPDCERLFIAIYRPKFWREEDIRKSAFTGTAVVHVRGHLELVQVAPMTPKAEPVPDAVAAVSPKFVAIYREAATAEAHELREIAGCGYRKALEFLVKDYAISRRPGDAEDIRKAQLGECIKSYVDDSKVKACAKRASWLGNDETHYERRRERKDLEDLKALIRLTVIWIESEILTEGFVEQMPDDRPLQAATVTRDKSPQPEA